MYTLKGLDVVRKNYKKNLAESYLLDVIMPPVSKGLSGTRFDVCQGILTGSWIVGKLHGTQPDESCRSFPRSTSVTVARLLSRGTVKFAGFSRLHRG